MSALGQKRTFTHLWPMSALPPIADIRTWPTPTSAVCSAQHKCLYPWRNVRGSIERRHKDRRKDARSQLLEYAQRSRPREADLHYFQEGLWYWGIDAEEELSLRRKRVEWAKQVVRETMGPFE